MKFFVRRLAASVGGLALALGTASCDYQKFSPGVNTQFDHSFSNPPGWNRGDVLRDSVNYKQNVHTPIGKGSARDQAQDVAKGNVQNLINSAPGGKSAASPQSASGQLAPVNKSTNGNGPNTNDQGNSSAAGAGLNVTNSKGKETGQ